MGKLRRHLPSLVGCGLLVLVLLSSFPGQALGPNPSNTTWTVFLPLVSRGSSSSFENSIYNIVMTPPSPATLRYFDPVDITFDYTTNEVGGVRIWTVPYTNGSRTPSGAYQSSPIYPYGAGSGTGGITVFSGDVIVDHIRFSMTTADAERDILVFDVPVSYEFTSGG